jgi:hypothetical protein
MEVVFVRTGQRRYAVEVHHVDGSVLRMDPASGFDEWFPHDLQHLVVEEQLGLRDGIYGQVARGGSASTFHPVAEPGGSTRTAARTRRKVAAKGRQLAGSPDIGRSERATVPVWQHWLAGCAEPDLQQRGREMATMASAIIAGMNRPEREALVRALPRTRERADELARRWAALPLGGALHVEWSPCSRT